MKAGDLVRATDLNYLCPREEILARKYDVIRVRHLKPDLQITMDLGHMFHSLYRNKYFGPMGEWAGAWECESCGWDTDHSGDSSPPVFGSLPGKICQMPASCPKCHRESIVFMEWEIADSKLCLSGHPDGWSWKGTTKRTVIDLKSHTPNGFSSLRSPMEGHDLQVMAYMHLCGDREGELWYLNKSPWGDALKFIRDIKVVFDVNDFNSRIRNPLEELQNGLSGGKVTNRICIASDFPRAKECQLADVCFE
jgi:hypothetical protein